MPFICFSLIPDDKASHSPDYIKRRGENHRAPRNPNLRSISNYVGSQRGTAPGTSASLSLWHICSLSFLLHVGFCGWVSSAYSQSPFTPALPQPALSPLVSLSPPPTSWPYPFHAFWVSPSQFVRNKSHSVNFCSHSHRSWPVSTKEGSSLGLVPIYRPNSLTRRVGKQLGLLLSSSVEWYVRRHMTT